jgi:hypothetical protein
MKIVEVFPRTVLFIKTDESNMPYRRSENSDQKVVMWEELTVGNWYTHDQEKNEELEAAYQDWLRADNQTGGEEK